MNVEPVWVSLDSILAIHDLQLSRFGGGSGLRDHGLLESAIARPLQIFCYSESVSLTQLAAAYAFGIIRNHPFIDGNKRTGFLAAYTFLAANGWRIEAEQQAVIAWTLGAASGQYSEEQYASWLESVAVKRESA